jgi:hypothetical protein
VVGVINVALEEPQDGDGDHHAGGGDEVGLAEAVPLPDRLGDQRRHESADVDAHVEDVVGAVLEVAPLGVEGADHGRDVRLEEAVADDHRGDARVHHRDRPQGDQGVSNP